MEPLRENGKLFLFGNVVGGRVFTQPLKRATWRNLERKWKILFLIRSSLFKRYAWSITKIDNCYVWKLSIYLREHGKPYF
jgi:hypothetical protein